MDQNQQKGFLLISLLVAIAIIAILGLLYYKKPGSTGKSTMQTGKQGIEDARQNKELQNQQQEQIQKQLNDLGM